MRKIFCIAVFALLLLPFSHAYGFSEKGKDCSKCHTLSKEEASTILKALGPGINVLDVMAVPVKGMWEVDIESGGRKVPVYIDFSKKYLLSGALIEINGKKNLTQARSEELNKIVLTKDDVAKIPLDDALVMGDKNAKHRIIVFDDPV